MSESGLRGPEQGSNSGACVKIQPSYSLKINTSGLGLVELVRAGEKGDTTVYPGSGHLAVGERGNFKKNNPTITQGLSRRCITTRGESESTYPRIPKAEAFSNAVDVVELLRDPTDPSTERTTPLRLAHVQLSDVPRALDLVEDEGEFH